VNRWLIVIGGAAIVGAALTGCTPGQKVSTTGHAKVVVDGQDQNAKGPVTCQKAGGALQIGIGKGGPNAVAVQATDANPPDVQQIALGKVNGVTLGPALRPPRTGTATSSPARRPAWTRPTRWRGW
jgi:ipoprotein LpqH